MANVSSLIWNTIIKYGMITSSLSLLLITIAEHALFANLDEFDQLEALLIPITQWMYVLLSTKVLKVNLINYLRTLIKLIDTNQLWTVSLLVCAVTNV